MKEENVNHIILHCAIAEFLWAKLQMKAGVGGPLGLVGLCFWKTDTVLGGDVKGLS